MQPTFRFSPRPNLAHQIRWREWGDEAFLEATRDDKPVLLAISAVWCHWCHVMDETSYSEPRVISLINERFIPVRVDNDQRPDVNLRYNLGGWPTTAVLTPKGQVLTGGTYIPPDRLMTMLRQAADAWAGARDQILARLAERQVKGENGVAARAAQVRRPVTWEAYYAVLAHVQGEYDEEHGGFGSAPKFPMPRALQLAMDAFVATGDEEPREIASKSLLAMAGRGMYDHVEGGFFRYATDREWAVPHFEKMLEDNAQLLELLVWAGSLSGDVAFRPVADDVVRYLEEVLFLPGSGCWAGSQDADEEYFALPLEARRQRQAPFVDPIIYAEWNGLLAGSLIRYAFLSGRWKYLTDALSTLDYLFQHLYSAERGMGRYLAADPTHGADAPTGSPKVSGLLHDQVAVGRAALLAYQATGDTVWLSRSRALADFCLDRLVSPEGALYDRPEDPAPGALAERVVDYRVNGDAACWLLELHQVLSLSDAPGDAPEGGSRYGQAGEAIAAWGSGRAGRYGLHGASMALAAAAALREWSQVTVVGPAGEDATRALLAVVLADFQPQAVVRLLDPAREPEEAKSRGYQPGQPPRAFLCRGKSCQAPVEDPGALADSLRQAFVSEPH